MNQTRVANHYVPKLYLKQWAASGLIPTYRLLVPSESCPFWKRQSLKGIAYHRHLYTYIKEDTATDEFERWLDSEFEAPAEEVIDRVVREASLTPEHWNRLIRFAIAQDLCPLFTCEGSLLGSQCKCLSYCSVLFKIPYGDWRMVSRQPSATR